ncbi:DUF202 domain-containing protein [Niallia sp. XMNu-256]|uniref:YidH family protein n=1 Tax=Niallia sp. XMNu-256 TaxID=3082444 RepID=UPI0030CFE87C
MDSKSRELDDHSQTVDSKFIQQHLANERTFLAWVRTAIAIIGVGFLVTNLHFTLKSSLSAASDLIATFIGLSSVGLGILTIILATASYFKKVKAINQQTFQTPKITVLALCIFIAMIALVLAFYFLIV